MASMSIIKPSPYTSVNVYCQLPHLTILKLLKYKYQHENKFVDEGLFSALSLFLKPYFESCLTLKADRWGYGFIQHFSRGKLPLKPFGKKSMQLPFQSWLDVGKPSAHLQYQSLVLAS